MFSHPILAGVLAGLAAVPIASAAVCPPLGPVLPAPRSPGQSNNVKVAASTLKAEFDAQFKSRIKASAISVGAKSLHQDDWLFNYHFTPPTLSGLGTNSIDENTIYRVGSVSKLMPVLALLRAGNVGLNDPLTKWIPELKNGTKGNEIDAVSWDDVTVGALAAHLAGIVTDSATDLAVFSQGPPWTNMGLPEVAKGTNPTCSGLGGTLPCTTKDIIEDCKRRPPVYLPYTTPVYSNVAYALLGVVVEAATNQTFKEAAKSSIFDVVGMNSTSFDGYPEGFLERGYIPMANEPTWNNTLGVFESAGGMFSSTTDLIALGQAILDHRLLSPAKTRQWLQPNAHTTSLGFSVGSPWEIGRSDTLTADGRTIDVYTKTGDLGMYHAVIALVPDYDLVVAVLTGGLEVSQEAATRTVVASAVLEALLPALEQAGRAEAVASGYVGTFVDEKENATLILNTDNGPGLVVESFTVNGFDVIGKYHLYNVGSLENPTKIATAEAVKSDARLYPSNRDKESGNGEETAWRAVIDTTTEEQKAALDAQIFYRNGSCVTWFGMDRAAYNFLGLADFVVVKNAKGAVTAIRNPAFNVTMARTNAPVTPRTGEAGVSERSEGAAGRVGAAVGSSLLSALAVAIMVL
ncbi:hypothetical protein OQA88_13408 [Cercophora sp. LCS_1]